MENYKWQILDYESVKALVDLGCLTMPHGNMKIFRISLYGATASIRGIRGMDTHAWKYAVEHKDSNKFLLISLLTYEQLLDHYLDLNAKFAEMRRQHE